LLATCYGNERIDNELAEGELDLLMNRPLLVFVGLLTFGSPASAQWGGGGAQVGATAYCASRSAGKNHNQAARAANNALVNSMGGNFSSNIATIITGGSAIRDSMLYLVKQQCPDLYYGTAVQSNPGNSSYPDKYYSSYCNSNPWEDDCKAGIMKSKEAQAVCDKALEKYDCKYIKYLDANPHLKDWVKANPDMARKEALRLNAADANEIGKPADKKRVKSAAERSAENYSGRKNVNCLNAADYKGCMEYHESN
tara:strand:+ start:74 stop:835 length:762 start_codon:yes stop_codon:yes gene_type:complete